MLPRQERRKADRTRSADLDGVSHPRSSFVAMNDGQQWMQRLDEFDDYLRDRYGGSDTQRQYHSFAKRWIDFCLPLRHDPAAFDEVLLDRMLDGGRDPNEDSRRKYRSYLRAWTRWASSGGSWRRSASTGNAEPSEKIAAWMARLDEYEAHLRNLGRKQETISDRRRKLSKWIEFACTTGRNPATWDPSAIDEAFVEWGTKDSQQQREDIRGRIRAWCKYWRGSDLDTLTLDELVQQFRDGRHPDGLVQQFGDVGYPDESVQHHQAARAAFESVLHSLANLSYADRHDLSAVWRRAEYGYGRNGAQTRLDDQMLNISEAGWLRMRNLIQALCFGDGDLATRFDDAVGGIDGLGPVVTTKFLAVTQPERFLPNFHTRHKDPKWPGKLDVIELLDRLGLLDDSAADEGRTLLEVPQVSRSSGDMVVRSNDVLLGLLRPYFTHDDVVDTWGMAQFLYWLARRHANDHAEPHGDDDAEPDTARQRLEIDLAALADDLLCEVGFLDKIVGLLEDKRQVILYGPPGTGKTYFARRLARALVDGTRSDDSAEGEPGAADSGAYSLVQFHPAYSYEDFFEGFRPQVDEDGQMTYKLTPGPLVRLAERAEEHSDELHVMVIDEINRANLPRVLGELLYLLEYRKEPIQTQYRPSEDFSLPKNLWFIGTMNTADRSIALIDAAMRRRFHFVPFFPDREPTAGLLRRWCAENELDLDWVADLLDAVNQRLRGDLGDDYMLIGPSHFMKHDLDENGLRRIWEYNIEPLIEDQFFGRQEVIDSYRFGEVWKRHGPSAAAPASEMGTSDGAGEEADPGSDRDEGPDSDGDL